MNKQHLPEQQADRRAVMLRELIGSMQQLHARRRRRRKMAALAVLFVMLCSSLVLLQPRTESQQHVPRVAESSTEAPTAPSEWQTRTVIVTTDPTITQRWSTHDQPRIVQLIDDEQLLATLQDMNRPTGLVRTAQRVWLTAAVTDDQPQRNQRSRPPSRQSPL